jgi:transposase
MQVTCERCAGVDVGKGETAAAVRLPGKGRDGRKTEKRKYRAFYGVLREVAGRLESLGVTHVAMEATGTYPQPAYCALAESGSEEVLACNAGHVKNVPGRKTGLSDAGWLAQLLECGLVRGSFIPPAEVKAVRDLVRYRAEAARQRVSEIARPGGTLQDAGIKTDSVASSIAARSGTGMTRALIDGERRGTVLAGLAEGTVRSKIPDLSMALEGRLDEHHALMCRLHPRTTSRTWRGPPRTPRR